jgi:CDP-glucose 4,6-dehydratase
MLASKPRSVVVASSDKAYGRSDHLPYRETDALSGREPYEASKAMADILATTYGVTYGLPTRITRCGNVYGPGDANWSRLIPGTILSLLRAERPVLRSDGSPVRDYVHVDDVARGYLAVGVADVPPGEAFNFSSGERLSVLEVVTCVAKTMGANIDPVVLGTAVGELQEQYLDSSKAERTLGWGAKRRLNESLPDIVNWYRGAFPSSALFALPHASP